MAMKAENEKPGSSYQPRRWLSISAVAENQAAASKAAAIKISK
jgi:hypothetical protein